MKDSIKRQAAAMGLTLVPRENRERPYTRKVWAAYKGERVLAVLATTSVQPFLDGYRAALLPKPGDIAKLTQGWRDHMIATHRKQVAIHEARKAKAS